MAYQIGRHLSMPALLREVRSVFESIPDEINGRGLRLPDYLMCGLAIYIFKFPSLLKFDQNARLNPKPGLVGNLKRLLDVTRVPSDTALRQRLDLLDPRQLRPVFKILFDLLQRCGVLKDFTVLGGRYVIAIDGTGFFSSNNIHCDSCCTKRHRDGNTSYSHQMLGAVLVHPDQKTVFPLAPEMIIRQDGATKNDCERNAVKRLVRDIRRDHPQLRAIMVKDALYSTGPNIELLKTEGFNYMLGAKRNDHKALFAEVDKVASVLEIKDEAAKRELRYRWANNVALNLANPNVKVNFLECRQTGRRGKDKKYVMTFSWVTDIEVTEKNVELLTRIGRIRWRIENETFQALKHSHSGYNFEHNFGHGKRHLANVFAYQAKLSFLIDQILGHVCDLFKAARANVGSNRELWEDIRSVLFRFRLTDWESLYLGIAKGNDPPEFVPRG